MSTRLTPSVTDTGMLGRIRRLDRCATPDGYLAVAAIDHPGSLLVPAGSPWPTHAAAVGLKLRVIEALAEHASGLLLDPVLSIAQSVLTGRLAGGLGLIANIDQVRETPEGLERTVDLRPGWTPRRIADSGADGAKYVFFHRAELADRASAADERIATLVADCHAVALPCIVEPIWYPLDGEDPSDPQVARDRASGIVEAAAHFAAMGADVLKVQFPGSVAGEQAQREAAAACRDLDDALEVPWVLLSEGVGYEDFRRQVEIAADAGASGFMVGRSVWSEAVFGGANEASLATVRARMAELTDILRRHGRPWRPISDVDTVEASVADDWWSTDG